MSDLFEYATGILIVVIELAITHLLTGIGSIICYRKTLVISYIPIIWMCVLLLSLVGWCFFIFDTLHGIEVLEYTRFLVFFTVSALMYLGAKLITPDVTQTNHLNLAEAFLETKTAFFLCWAAALLLVNIYVYASEGSLESMNSVEGVLGLLLIGLMLVGSRLRKMEHHLILVVGWTFVYLWQEFVQGAIGA
jgi:hypothetical protein